MSRGFLSPCRQGQQAKAIAILQPEFFVLKKKLPIDIKDAGIFKTVFSLTNDTALKRRNLTLEGSNYIP